MAKITFLGAGSTVFAKNVLGDCMSSPVLSDAEISLYDIDPVRLKESELMLTAIRNNLGSNARIQSYCGVENRRKALHGTNYAVNAIQVGGYDPCTITDLKSLKSTACGRRLPIRWAWAVCFAHCGRFRHVGFRPRYGRRVPERLVAELYKPHGYSDRRHANDVRHSNNRPMP